MTDKKKKDKETCGTCGAFKFAQGNRGHCRAFPPPQVKRDDQCDAFPCVAKDSWGCLQHTNR